jgi:hypothetical protein
MLTVIRLGLPDQLRRALGCTNAIETGGNAYKPSSFGTRNEPGHQEERRPSTKVPT